jgi:hypothetical protein
MYSSPQIIYPDTTTDAGGVMESIITTHKDRNIMDSISDQNNNNNHLL